MQLYQNKDSSTGCFPVNIIRFLRTPFLQKTLREIASAFLSVLFSIDLLIFCRVADLAQRNALSFAQKESPEKFSKKRCS